MTSLSANLFYADRPQKTKPLVSDCFWQSIPAKGRTRCQITSLNNLAFKSFYKGYAEPNAWLSENPDNVTIYNNNPLCGFIFTTNGFINLLTLQKEAFNADNWHPRNPKLPILVMAGEDDPVIISERKFQELLFF